MRCWRSNPSTVNDPQPKLAPVNSPRAVARWSRSIPTVATVMDLIAESYPVDAIDAVLVRSFTNDVFQIRAGHHRYALKIYGAGRFSTDEVRWEQQLARHLVNVGLPVAADVPLLDEVLGVPAPSDLVSTWRGWFAPPCNRSRSTFFSPRRRRRPP